MSQHRVPMFSVVIRFWLNREMGLWQGELREVPGNRVRCFSGMPELTPLLERLMEEGAPTCINKQNSERGK